MTSHDLEYYRARAAEERQAAANASRIEVRRIHLDLARLYEEMARQPEPRATLEVA
ncbi:MAG TPA: hypothetical protein VEB39_06080 [Sphingomicrobium sp.]|nr:hypothetical protein [Sphingomicrobium sp.]